MTIKLFAELTVKEDPQTNNIELKLYIPEKKYDNTIYNYEALEKDIRQLNFFEKLINLLAANGYVIDEELREIALSLSVLLSLVRIADRIAPILYQYEISFYQIIKKLAQVGLWLPDSKLAEKEIEIEIKNTEDAKRNAYLLVLAASKQELDIIYRVCLKIINYLNKGTLSTAESKNASIIWDTIEKARKMSLFEALLSVSYESEFRPRSRL
jgi:hypothetical protein